MTTPRKPDMDNAPTGVNDDPPPSTDDRPEHEDETLGDLLGDRDPESASRSHDRSSKK